jgi:hypothetical protein
VTRVGIGGQLEWILAEEVATPEVIEFTEGFVVNFLELGKNWGIGGINSKTFGLYAADACAKFEELGYVYKLVAGKAIMVKENEPKYLGLTSEQYKRLIPILNSHIRVWGQDSLIEQHSLNNIEKAYWVPEECCFHVHYKETEEHRKVWYHYDSTDGTWW